MCLKRLKISSLTSKKLYKVLLACSLLALLALQPLQAWPTKSQQETTKIAEEAIPLTQLIAQAQQIQPLESSTSSNNENMTVLQDYAQSLKDELVKEVNPNAVIVIKSTVPVGYTEGVIEKYNFFEIAFLSIAFIIPE